MDAARGGVDRQAAQRPVRSGVRVPPGPDLRDRDDVFAGWAAYINAYDSPEQEAKRAALAEAARKAAEHDDLMNQAAKAIR
jgi:hypothetical protein